MCVCVCVCVCVGGGVRARARACVCDTNENCNNKIICFLVAVNWYHCFSAERICLKTGALIPACSGLNAEKEMTSYFCFTSSVFSQNA